MKHYLKSALLALCVAVIGITWAGRDGSGTYTLPAGNPVSTGTTISSTWANTTLTDIATALTNSIAKDGQTVPTANLPMGGFSHTNVANATARNRYAAAGQVQDFSLQVLSSVSGTDTIIGSLNPAITSYATGMVFTFTPAFNNTGAATLAINGLAARSIVKWDGIALAGGDLVAGLPAFLVASGTQFVLLNPQNLKASSVLASLLTVDGAGSGLDADLLDGQSSAFYQSASNLNAGTLADARVAQSNVTQHQAALGAETATASTIARRNASGYLFGAYLNQSSAVEAPTVGAFFVENSGADGYLRKVSVANSAAALQGSISIAASQVTSGTFADARVAQSNVTQHQGALTTRNITGKTGTTKNLVPNASCPPAVSGEDGRITYCY